MPIENNLVWVSDMEKNWMERSKEQCYFFLKQLCYFLIFWGEEMCTSSHYVLQVLADE